MHFTNSMRILRGVLCSLYSFVIIIPYISVSVSETHAKFDTESDIKNNKSRNLRSVYIKYLPSLNNEIDKRFIYWYIAILVPCMLFIMYYLYSSTNCIAVTRKFMDNLLITIRNLLNRLIKFCRAFPVEPVVPRNNQQDRNRDERIVLDTHSLQQSAEEEVNLES